MKLPNQPKKGDSFMGWGFAVVRYLRAQRIVGISGGRIEEGPNGTKIIVDQAPPRGRGAAATVCHFGEIITLPEGGDFARGIRGGVIYCGDQNFNVEPFGIDLGTDASIMVYIELTCESNRDDAGEILLPGINTSADFPTWETSAYVPGDDNFYPANTNPDASDGIGTIIIPIGILTVLDGAATLDPVNCGNITINQCGGTLTHTRG